jgi:hypothetical protein
MKRTQTKKSKAARIVTINQYTAEWNLAQRIARITQYLDQLPDAGAVKGKGHRAAPLQMVEMVF